MDTRNTLRLTVTAGCNFNLRWNGSHVLQLYWRRRVRAGQGIKWVVRVYKLL